MNTVIPSPAIRLSEQPYSVHFSKSDSEDRAEVERFISDVFYEAYGAKIRRFKPCLMSLRDRDNNLVAACGFRSAAVETLFLENYLDRPIEAFLSENTGLPVRRNEIVEVGNFSVIEPGMARFLIASIVAQLHATSNEWAVFTAVPMVRNAFIKMDLIPLILGTPDKNLLPTDEQSEWGSYYDQKPQIMAIRRVERRNNPRITETGMPESVACLQCRSCI